MNAPKFNINDLVVNVNTGESEVVTAISIDPAGYHYITDIWSCEDIRSYHWSTLSNYVKQSEYKQFLNDQIHQSLADLNEKRHVIDLEIEKLKKKLEENACQS